EARAAPAASFAVVVAIDFGTTSSGYAFSFRSDPDTIHMMRRWEGGDPGVANQKTPTSLLLTPAGAFHSFGYTARDYYHDLDPEEARDWLYFEKFKMKIHSTSDLSMQTELEAVNGKKVRALEVFAHALRFFKQHALQELREQSPALPESGAVRWVITVPAIWKQPAKQFMREAAY
ncbi:HS12B protein, partial [Eudromia elegans]|nr:HS12B protein [Eudromia elegans]